MMDFAIGEEHALELDATDTLAKFKERFYKLPGSIYMDGNSLGLMSRDAERTLMRIIEEWKTFGIKGWGEAKIPWIHYAEKLGELQAPLVGASIEEVVVTHHGPVISDVVGAPDRPLAVQSMALQPCLAIEGWFRLNRALGWDDFAAAMRLIEAPQLNVPYADVEGNIGYWVTGKVPVRAKG